MAWRLNAALTNWRAAVDQAYPNRDRTSDGTIGDAAHAAGTSDHNPDADGTVDAWDMDVDLRSGNDQAAIEGLKRVFQAHPAARYWIHNRVIAHRNTGWRRETYTGSNAHTQHVHWNSNEATEDSTAPWNLEDDDMTPGQDQKLNAINERVNGLVKMFDTITTGWSANPTGKEALPAVTALRAAGQLAPALASVAAELAALKADVAELKARPAAVITLEMHEEAMRRILGSVDGATPQA